MTNAEFITGVRLAVYERTVQGVVSVLKKPPGRAPSQNLVELSEWFTQLLPDDAERVRAAIRLTARHSVSGMLSVLDGTRSIAEAAGEGGDLELRFTNSEGSILLNDPEAISLHDLFSQQVPPP